jgi:hypothetical protein
MSEMKNMTTKRIEMERFRILSFKPFHAVLEALEAAIGRPKYGRFCHGAPRRTVLR